jgi:hypothetical protein
MECRARWYQWKGREMGGCLGTHGLALGGVTTNGAGWTEPTGGVSLPWERAPGTEECWDMSMAQPRELERLLLLWPKLEWSPRYR